MTLADWIDEHNRLPISGNAGERIMARNWRRWVNEGTDRLSLSFDVEYRLERVREKLKLDPEFQEATEHARVEQEFRSLKDWIERKKKFPSKRSNRTLHDFLSRLKSGQCVLPQQYKVYMQEWTRCSHEDEAWLALENPHIESFGKNFRLLCCILRRSTAGHGVGSTMPSLWPHTHPNASCRCV